MKLACSHGEYGRFVVQKKRRTGLWSVSFAAQLCSIVCHLVNNIIWLAGSMWPCDTFPLPVLVCFFLTMLHYMRKQDDFPVTLKESYSLNEVPYHTRRNTQIFTIIAVVPAKHNLLHAVSTIYVPFREMVMIVAPTWFTVVVQYLYLSRLMLSRLGKKYWLSSCTEKIIVFWIMAHTEYFKI